MRILIVGETYYPGSNGQAAFTIRLAEGLADQGHQVMVMVPGARLAVSEENIHGVRVFRLPAISIGLFHPETYMALPAPWLVAQVIDSFHPDVVHIQDHYPTARAVVSLARRRKLPIVGTNHFLPENVLPYFNFVPLHQSTKVWILWQTMRNVYRHARIITTPTETAARILREQKLGSPVHPISCGVDTTRFRPLPDLDRAAVRRKYGLHPDRALILYVGRLDGEKRIDLLIHALHLLRRSDVHLCITGKGALGGALTSLTHRLHLDEQVTFTGYVPAEELPSLLNSADLFAMPSPQELQSIATLEAMATGRPILAANARALPELVAHGVNGYLFRPDDPQDAALWMARLLDERDRWPAMGQASLERARAHSLENTIRSYCEVYRTLIDGRVFVPHPATERSLTT